MRRFVILFGALLATTTIFQRIGHTQVFFTATIDSSGGPVHTISNGTGTAWAVLNPSTATLKYQITYANLDSTFIAAHFHYGSASDASGPVVMPITTWVGNTAAGTWSNIPDSIVAAIMKGDIYINIHSKKYPAGEIRGQLEPAPDFGVSISLDGAQEGLSVNGTGTGWGVFLPDTNAIMYRITVAGLSSPLTAAHFHLAPAESNGPVEHNLNMTDSTVTGVWYFPDTSWTALVTDSMYANVHTTNHPAGEIRGQLTLEPSNNIFLKGTLQGENQVPPSISNGMGAAWVVVNVTPGAGGTYPTPATANLTYRLTYADLDSNFTAAHFHYGVDGTNGPVVFGITTWVGNTAQGTWTSLPDSVLDALLDGGIYLNVHSLKYPKGEIRGQLERTDGTPFAISLSSNQSVPPDYTSGTGTGWAVLDTTGTTVTYDITVASLSSMLTAAHFHIGTAGENGIIAQGLTYSDSTASGEWSPVPDSLLTNLLNGGIYANFHTVDYPKGEIRGQLMLDNGFLTAIKTVSNDAPPSRFELAQNYPNPFNPSTVISFSLPSKENVQLEVYNILGQRVASLLSANLNAGIHVVRFDGSRYASGVYFYMLRAGNNMQVKKMLLLK